MKVLALCTLSTGLLGVQLARRYGVEISKVVGIDPIVAKSGEDISGYADVAPFCGENNLEFGYVDRYNLADVDPGDLVGDADLIWVAGWQRLIPQRVISKAPLGAVGVHGSCDGITLGRGRSPQNWAILIGAQTFEVSLFDIEAGVDDGDIIASDRFEISASDTIVSSYAKTNLCIAKIMSNLSRDASMLERALAQRNEAQYFPKRTPEDGFIDWAMDVSDIARQIRALADPYPNARSKLGEDLYLFNAAQEISCILSEEPGTVLHCYPEGEFLVAAGNGALLISSCSVVGKSSRSKGLRVGERFESYPMQNTIDTILLRFSNEFPGKQLNRSLSTFWTQRGYKINYSPQPPPEP